MKGITTSRNSSFELLRLVLMLLIIIHHSIVHGLGLAYMSGWSDVKLILPDNQMLTACVINSLCICGVNCFILISGYFGIRSSIRKIIYLIITLLLYTVLLNVIPLIIEGDYKSAVSNCLFISHSSYWFVIDYLILMVFAPLINDAFERFSTRNQNLFVVTLLIISCYLGWMWGHQSNPNGYTLLQFILMYCIGRRIKNADIRISKLKSSLLYFLTAIVCGFLMYGFWYMGKDSLAWKMTYYNNPLIIASAIGIFLLFKDFHIENQHINKMAKSSIGIYLFQSSILVGTLQYGWIQNFITNYLPVCGHKINEIAMGGGIYLIIISLSTLIESLAIIFYIILSPLLNFLTELSTKLIERNLSHKGN